MARDDVYDESVRMYTVLVQRAKEYGYDAATSDHALNHFIE